MFTINALFTLLVIVALWAIAEGMREDSINMMFFGVAIFVLTFTGTAACDYFLSKKEDSKPANTQVSNDALPEKPVGVTDTTPTDDDSKVTAVAYSGIIPVSGELWCDKPDPNPYVDKDKAIKFCFKILDVALKGDKCFMKYKQYHRYKNTLNDGFIVTDRCSMIDFMEKEYDTLVYRDSE